jgi:hypothetical protein
MVFLPQQRQDAFYQTVEKNRQALYARTGFNLQANYGRWVGAGADPKTDPQFAYSGGFYPREGVLRYPPGDSPSPALLNGYSAFTLRSVEQDEQAVLNIISRFKLRPLQINPHYTQIGGAYIYPLAGFFVGLHLGRYLHLVPNPLYYYQHPEEMAKLYIAGRLLNVLENLLCAIFIFLIGKLVYDETVGLWAALLFGVSPVAVANAHVMKPHWTGALWALACLFYCLKYSSLKKPADLLLASLGFGLAVGTSKYYWILAFPIWISFVAAHEDWYSWKRLKTLIALNLLSVAVFFLTNPYALFSWKDTLDEARGMANFYHPSANPRGVFNLLRYPLPAGLGVGTWIMGLAGLVYYGFSAHRSGRRLVFIFLSLLLPTAFQLSAETSLPITLRLFLPGTALFVIFATAWALRGPLSQKTSWAKPALLGLCLSVELFSTVLYDANFIADSPKYSNSFIAGRWIMDHIPPGESI